MKRSTKSMIIRMGKLLHYVLSVGLFTLALYLFYDNMYPIETDGKRFMLIVGIYGVLILILRHAYNSYDVEFTSGGMLFYSHTLTHIIAIAFMYFVLVLDFWNYSSVSPLPLLGLLAIQTVINCIWSYSIHNLYHKLNKVEKSLIICGCDRDFQSVQEIYKLEKHFSVEKIIMSPSDDMAALRPEIINFDAIFVSGVSASLRNGIVKECVEHNISCYVAPLVGDIIMMGAHHIEQFSNPIFLARRRHLKFEYAFIKRSFDIALSLFGLVVTSPLMLITALAVKLYDKGPVLYKQVRLTKNGKEFEILKFRSMRTNAESDGVARLATSNDDRITPVGKIIRACRLDELPQLFNILRGDMSFVGPRPERPEIAEQYCKELHSFPLRLQVRAGLTGLAQVYGKYNTVPYDKLRMDLMYINKMSVATDLKLILATIKILFMKESTSGVNEGQVTASAEEQKTVATKQK